MIITAVVITWLVFTNRERGIFVKELCTYPG